MVSEELKETYNEFPMNIKAYFISNRLAPEQILARESGQRFGGISSEIYSYEDYEFIRDKCIRLCKGRDTLQSKCSDYLKKAMRLE